jgi:photosystem II stability/assembly factor-like uncharacterized protein
VGTSFEEDEFGPTDPVLLSTNDAGATWDIVGTGLPGGPISFVSIAYNPFNPADVLVCSGPGGLTHEDGEGDGLYLSKDEGVSFSRVASEHCNTFRDAAWDPHNEGVVLATCEAGILLSEDSGDTWALALPSDVPPMSFPIAWDPEHPGIVVAGADSDLLVRSLDSGQSWLDLASDLLAAGEFEAIHNLAGLAFNADGTEIWATFPLGPPWRGRPVAE